MFETIVFFIELFLSIIGISVIFIKFLDAKLLLQRVLLLLCALPLPIYFILISNNQYLITSTIISYLFSLMAITNIDWKKRIYITILYQAVSIALTSSTIMIVRCFISTESINYLVDLVVNILMVLCLILIPKRYINDRIKNILLFTNFGFKVYIIVSLYFLSFSSMIISFLPQTNLYNTWYNLLIFVFVAILIVVALLFPILISNNISKNYYKKMNDIEYTQIKIQSMAGLEHTNTMPYVGCGWRLSVQQTLLPSSEFGLTGDNATNFPYVYTDEDGTDHYFYKKDSKYIDEDGLKLELTIGSPNSSKYTIKDDKDNMLIFNNNGLLVKTTDSNGNSVTVNYASDKKTISTISDASENKITFKKTPNSDNGYLQYIEDPAERSTEYNYTSGKLTKIIKPNGKYVTFTYDTEGSMTSVTDVDGYKVEFTYTSSKSGKKVSSIKEIGYNGTAGQKITFDRTKYNTTIIKTYGADGISGTTDDLTSTYQFDEFGRTISIKSKTTNRDLGASVYKYTDGVKNSSASNIKQLNRVSTEYSTGSNAVNLIKNQSLESNSNWTTASWGGTNNFTAVSDSSQQYFGQKSMKINCTAYEGDSRSRVYQDFSNTILKPGSKYTLSGYIKTVGVTNGSENSGALLCAESFNSDGTSNLYYTDFVYGNTTTSIDNGWQRVSKTFTVPSNSSKTRVNLALRQSTGTAYFDGIQLEEYSVANDCNLLENGGLENYSSNGLPTGWYDNYSTLNSSVDFQSTNHHYQGTSSFRMKGDSSTRKAIYQTVKVSGSENDTYIVSGWARASAVPRADDDSRKFKININVKYSDGTSVIKSPAEFNHSVTDWQYTSAAFNLSDKDNATNKTPVSITIYLSYQYQANYAYFDNICLVKDNAQSYTYDSDGNLISVVDNSEEKSKMEYTNSDLTKNIDAKGYAYKYEYDEKTHNMTKATSQTEMTYNYTYNTRGLSTNLEVKDVESKTILNSSVEYDASGFLKKSYDQDGKVIEYSYDTQKGICNSVVDKRDSDNNIITSYEYDPNTDLAKSVTQTDDYGDTYTMSYMYSDDSKQLKKISRNSTDYNIEYDQYGNKTDSKVGTQSLANYTYNSGNGALISSTYGTGKSINYTYDAFGNTSSIKYNGQKAFEWTADRSGNVVRENDLINNVQYDFTYDSTGRLVRKTAKDTTKAYNANNLWYNLEYGYDINNNVTRLVYRMPQRSVLNKYTYGDDNLLKKYDINGSRSVSYEYDGLNRLDCIVLSTDRQIETKYNYYKSLRGDKYTTTKLESETIDGVIYKYTYDAFGNITEIKNGRDKVLSYYEYDSMNQLTYVADYENSKVYSYGYDTGGNLIAENVSDIGTNGSPSNTRRISYLYGDDNWKDKLTNYNGQTITYDAIGNPLSYRDGMTMTWKNGRQLATLQTNENSISYNYDSNSVRISKTVNGVKYTYAYINGLLMYETRGDAKFYYSYDANGTLYSVKYTLTDSSNLLTYYYTHNSRGDIVGIYNGAGQLRAHYEYDAWGNVLSVTDQNGNAITSSTHIGNLNPFRYRGYYLDTETGLYYLMSRYYDPVTHRFVNADGYFQSGGDVLDCNMSAYCRNNPVKYLDIYGTKVYTIGISGLLCIGFAFSASIYYAFDDQGNYGIFYSVTDYAESGGCGIINASASGTISTIWDADTIDDLSRNYQNWGFSIGEGLSLGADMIWLKDNDYPSGASISLGAGCGIDLHAYTTTTNYFYKSNDTPTAQNTKPTQTTTPKSSTKCCRYCGKPIGSLPWQCSGGWR